ncbi:MAG: hypothetical protein ACKPKO_45425, partial [Candidatus Fonsibacter sp.]
MRDETNAWNDVVAQDQARHMPSTSSLPRERLGELPRERPYVSGDLLATHPAPENYWITPPHVSPDVMELSDGSSTFLAI